VIYLLGALAVAVLLFCGGWAAGRITLHDRRRDVADLQATLDRTRRWRDETDADRHPTVPFPVGPDYLALSDITAGWDAIERQQRGWPGR
jgi:hypothetical protein